MGWSKRSSGRRYDSQSGHTHVIGLYTRKTVYTFRYNKICRKCQLAKVKGEEAVPHKCAQNYAHDKHSKSMESDAILNICKNTPRRNYLVEAIISNNNANMHATLKHENGTNKGRLPVSSKYNFLLHVYYYYYCF